MKNWQEERCVVYIEGVVCKEVDAIEAMNWVFSEDNTEEHMLHIYTLDGKEIGW